jgi:RNA-directed DNA polymerase
VAIPKGPGTEGTRPLGIPTVEDRLVQRAVARILDAVFAGDCLDGSYGFRPGRSPHQALRALRGTIVTKKVRHLFEADIRGCFDHINQQWLRQMVAHRIADPVILRLIGQWLRAGVMQGGVVMRTVAGTPQGGPRSPVLATVYLHFVLDLWFEKKFRPWCQGEAYLTRFADDFVARIPYRYPVGVRAETGARCGILGASMQTSKDRAKTGVEDSPLARLVLVRHEVMTGGVVQAGRRPR